MLIFRPIGARPGSGHCQPGGWLLSCHGDSAAGVAGLLSLGNLAALLGSSSTNLLWLSAPRTWSYRDQGGTTANYTDHILTKIAADNYISQQTGEQSIILAAEQRRPVVSTGIGQTRRWGAIQFTPPLIGDTAVAVKFHT